MPLRSIHFPLASGAAPPNTPAAFADGAANSFSSAPHITLKFTHRDNGAVLCIRTKNNTRKGQSKMNESNRPDGRVVSIRLLPEEAEVLAAKAKEANMSKARFLKNVIAYRGAYKETNFTSDDSHKLMYEINRIGNNLEQIAIRAHGNKDIDIIDFWKLRDNYLGLITAFYYFIYGIERKIKQ